MKCPSCGHDEPDDSTSCGSCQIVYEKWRKLHAPPQPSAPQPSGGPQEKKASYLGPEAFADDERLPDFKTPRLVLKGISTVITIAAALFLIYIYFSPYLRSDSAINTQLRDHTKGMRVRP